MRSCPDYITAYFNKHTAAQNLLTHAMIETVFINFKCNFEMVHQDEVEEHSKIVHGVSITKLRKKSTLVVDAKLPFVLNPALNIE